MLTIFLIVLAFSTTISLGSLFVYKSYLLAKGQYEAVLEGDEPVKRTYIGLFVKGGIFLILSLVIIFSTVTQWDNFSMLLVRLFAIALCGINAYWGISYGFKLFLKRTAIMNNPN